MEFMTDIQHVVGRNNPVTDTCTVSRPTIAIVQLAIDNRAIAIAQKEDPEVQAYCTAHSSLQPQDLPFEPGEVTLMCDMSTGKSTTHRSTSWRQLVLRQFMAYPTPQCIQH